ncbi:MAG: alpha/beta hydrolase [Bacteroidota bacterium]
MKILFYLFVCSLPILNHAQKPNVDTYVYATVDGEELRMDVYTPDNTEELHPAMVWVHGGGFAFGSRDATQEVKLMEYLVDKGYTGISISYRLLRQGEKTGFGCDCPRAEKENVFRESARDVWRALEFVHKHASDWGIDTTKLILGGSSAGAEAILTAVYLHEWVDPEMGWIRNHLPSMVLSMAGAVVDSRYINANNAVPGIFFHGTADPLVPYGTSPHHFCASDRPGYLILDGSSTIITKLKSLDQSSALFTYPDRGHEIASIQYDQMGIVLALADVLFEGGSFSSQSEIKEE